MHTSVAGSMAYVAPEMEGWCCDFWGLGVTAYELMFHKHPFDGRTAEKMTRSILKASFLKNRTNITARRVFRRYMP
jgi:serine/threonine kinase 32